ncbi:MAG: alpha/beta hydrolase [Clostridiales bacterium]|nr:alpha/beta hydrolase [Clostridiales bacterium]
MAYEMNTKRLAAWAAAGTFAGPGAPEHMKRFALLTKPSDEPERVRILQDVYNEAIAEMDTIPLWADGNVPGWKPEIERQNKPQIAFFPAVGGGRRGCILVAPGGGYDCKVSGSEGYPVIWGLVNAGFHCALLDYRLKPYSQYRSVQDASRAIRILRSMAEELDVLPDKIGMIGASAGGSLTCLTCVHWDKGDPNAADPVERVSSRPDAGLVMYGCFTAVSWPGSDAFMKMREDGEDFVMPRGGLVSVYMDEQRPDKYWFSPEKWVNPQTPPFFLWQTTDMDDPRNMFCFAKELADAGVRFEAHIYPFGPHGMAMANGTGLGPKDAHVAHWFTQATEWLDIYGFGGEKA